MITLKQTPALKFADKKSIVPRDIDELHQATVHDMRNIVKAVNGATYIHIGEFVFGETDLSIYEQNQPVIFTKSTGELFKGLIIDGKLYSTVMTEEIA